MPCVTPPPDTQAAILLDQLGGLLQVARALAGAGRALDLAGLDLLAGRVAAACLDLPPEQGRALRPRLAALLGEIDALATLCTAPSGTAP